VGLSLEILIFGNQSSNAMTKTIASEVLDRMPNEFSVEEFTERLKFMERMERGKQQYLEGKTLTHEEAMKRLEQRWQK
jgi:hypothetical protein